MSIDPYKLKWYILYTKSRHEKKVKDALDKMEVENYLPIYKTLKQYTDRKKWVVEPLFKSYIFIRTNGKKYFDILNTNGVSGFVRFNGEPAIISDKQLNDIQLILDSEKEVDVSTEKLELWQKIRVRHGPFTGVEGYLYEIRGSKKVVVQIEAIERSLLVDVSARDIEVVSR